MKLGFVGLGVVGGAVAKAFSERFITVGYDIKTAPDTKEQLLTADMIFLSLPTPTVKGAQDLSATDQTCGWLKERDYKGPVIIKSTVLPGTCDMLKKTYGLKIVHNPEFLTAKSPLQDFMRQPSVLLSGSPEDILFVTKAYYRLLSDATVLGYNSYLTTEIAKYTHNLFLATKVGFLNEIFKVCQKTNANYDVVIHAALSQEKLGDTHTKVPNLEKESGMAVFGFGGSCFPKDIQALLTWAKEHEIELEQMNATNEANLKIRPETCLK